MKIPGVGPLPGWAPQMPQAPQPARAPSGPAGVRPNMGGGGDAARRAVSQASPAPTGPAPGPVSGLYGSESGPTYLEDRYTSRLNGTDAAADYALKRGGDDIDRRMAAGGSFNSGARGQQLGDYGANVYAKSQEQLDSLAAGATGARQRKLESMFGEGIGIAGGQAGVQSSYDRAIADMMNGYNSNAMTLGINKAGVDSQANQQLIQNGMSIAGLALGMPGAPRGGGGGDGPVSGLYPQQQQRQSYIGDGLMQPTF